MTMIEVLMAVAMASFIVAIGFTGINAFGRALARSKQISAETQIITAITRLSISEANENAQSQVGNVGRVLLPSGVTVLNVPSGWPEVTADMPNNLLKIKVLATAGQSSGATIYRGLGTDTNYQNTIKIKAPFTYN